MRPLAFPQWLLHCTILLRITPNSLICYVTYSIYVKEVSHLDLKVQKIAWSNQNCCCSDVKISVSMFQVWILKILWCLIQLKKPCISTKCTNRTLLASYMQTKRLSDKLQRFCKSGTIQTWSVYTHLFSCRGTIFNSQCIYFCNCLICYVQLLIYICYMLISAKHCRFALFYIYSCS